MLQVVSMVIARYLMNQATNNPPPIQVLFFRFIEIYFGEFYYRMYEYNHKYDKNAYE